MSQHYRNRHFSDYRKHKHRVCRMYIVPKITVNLDQSSFNKLKSVRYQQINAIRYYKTNKQINK